MNHDSYDDAYISGILNSVRSIAIVGASANEVRPSFFVTKYLIDKGVDKARLQAKGYGPDKPIGDNKQAAGRQKNRRVEFNILKSAKKSQAAPPP